MSLPSFGDALSRSADRMAFSNGTEGDAWMERWCYRCVNDMQIPGSPSEEGCPLLLVAMIGKMPAEWQEQDRMSLGNQYCCTEFEAMS